MSSAAAFASGVALAVLAGAVLLAWRRGDGISPADATAMLKEPLKEVEFLRVEAESLRAKVDEMGAEITRLRQRVLELESANSLLVRMLRTSNELPSGEFSVGGLHQLIVERLNDTELRAAVLNLDMSDVRWGNLDGDSMTARALSLVNRLRQRGAVGELLSVLQDMRPDVSWGESDSGSVSSNLERRL